jgi:hypothetical protein
MRIAVIGNGIYAHTNAKPSLFEQYRAKQAKCPHTKRDPRGTCYECGHKDEVDAARS